MRVFSALTGHTKVSKISRQVSFRIHHPEDEATQDREAPPSCEQIGKCFGEVSGEDFRYLAFLLWREMNVALDFQTKRPGNRLKLS